MISTRVCERGPQVYFSVVFKGDNLCPLSPNDYVGAIAAVDPIGDGGTGALPWHPRRLKPLDSDYVRHFDAVSGVCRNPLNPDHGNPG